MHDTKLNMGTRILKLNRGLKPKIYQKRQHNLLIKQFYVCNYYFLLIIYIYKMDNLIVIAITTTIVTSFIPMTEVSIILLAENTNEEINQRIWAYRQPIPYVHSSLNWVAAKEVFVQEMMRFTKNKIDKILSYLELETICYCCQFVVSPEIALAVLCMQLSYPKRLKTIIHHFGYSRNWLSIVFNDMIMYLAQHYKKILHWDNKRLTFNKCLEYAKAIQAVGDGHYFWGYINRTTKQIC